MIIPKLFKDNWKKFLIVFLVCFYFLIAILLLSRNYLLLGGEGNYFLDFNLENSYIGTFSWATNLQGTGFPNPTLNSTVGIFNFFSLLQRLGMPFKIINIFSVFLVYTLPFLSIYWLLNRILKIKFSDSFLISLFYILNPFCTYHLQGLMFWNVAPLFVLPLAFGILYKYFFNKFKLFLIFGLFTSIFAFSFSNIPYLGIFHIFLFISIITISYLYKAKFELKAIFKNILITELSFFLFSCWWIINLFRFYLYDISKFYPKSFAISWAKVASGTGNIINKIFSVRQLLHSGYDNYFSHFYFNPIIIPILFIPFIVLIILLFKNKYSGQANKNGLVVFIFLLLVFYLNKGINYPFGSGYLWAVINIPFFGIFKSPLEKFSILLVFLFSLNLAFAFNNVKNKIYYEIFIFYLLICSIPYLTLNFIPDFKVQANMQVSSQFSDKSEYKQVREVLNKEKSDYRILSLPGSLNYQVAMLTHDQKYYTGMDPILYAINKPFIAAYSGEQFNVIYDNISNENFNKIISLFNIKKILLNKDIYPWFGFREKETIPELSEILSEKMSSWKNGSMELYKVDPQYFLPHFYIPKRIIYTNTNIEGLPDVLNFGDWETRSGIYLSNINKLTNSKTNGLEELKKRADEVFERAELENAVTEEKLGIGLPVVSFPYVKNKPGGLMYRLVFLNENFDKWKSRKEPEELFEKHLFYASKRIAELEKFKINIVNELTNYEKEMIGAIEEVKKCRNLGLKNFRDWGEQVIKLRVYLETHRRKVDQLDLGEDFKERMRVVFDDLEGKTAELETKQEFSRLVYKFDVPREGEYEIFIKNINGLKNPKINELNIDGLTNLGENTGNQTLEIGNKVETNGGWVKLGERNFPEGEQELVLPFSGISENLIDENLRIKDYTPDSIYRIVFDYKAPIGGVFFVAEGEMGETARTDLFPTGEKLEHFEMFFKSSLKVAAASVHLSISVAEEKNLKVERIYQPEMMIKSIKEIDKLTIYDKKVPQITFVKINLTKYRVKVEGATQPYTLVFSESFHQGWKLYINELTDSKINELNNYGEILASYFDGEIKEGTHRNILLEKATFETWGEEPLAEERHLIINEYANSWYIRPEDTGGQENYELIIEFQPQRLLYLGLGISSATLLICLGYLGYSFRRKMWFRREIKQE